MQEIAAYIEVLSVDSPDEGVVGGQCQGEETARPELSAHAYVEQEEEESPQQDDVNVMMMQTYANTKRMDACTLELTLAFLKTSLPSKRSWLTAWADMTLTTWS